MALLGGAGRLDSVRASHVLLAPATARPRDGDASESQVLSRSDPEPDPEPNPYLSSSRSRGFRRGAAPGGAPVLRRGGAGEAWEGMVSSGRDGCACSPAACARTRSPKAAQEVAPEITREIEMCA